MIDAQYKTVLRGFASSVQFQAIAAIILELTKMYREQGGKQETEFQTLWQYAEMEGRIKGLNTLRDELERLSYEPPPHPAE